MDIIGTYKLQILQVATNYLMNLDQVV